MESIFEKVQRNVNEYVEKKQLKIVRELGWGMDGLVLMVEPKAAVKIFKYSEQYRRELDVYQRLHSKSVFQVLDFNIPRLIDHDDELKIIEMNVVNPPFVLDFPSLQEMWPITCSVQYTQNANALVCGLIENEIFFGNWFTTQALTVLKLWNANVRRRREKFKRLDHLVEHFIRRSYVVLSDVVPDR